MSPTPPHSTLPTLILQIPFHLVGTHPIHSNIYSNASRHTAPLFILRDVLKKSCADVPIEVWIPSAEPVLTGREHNDKAEVELEDRVEKWTKEEKRRWEKVQSQGWILRSAEEEPSGQLSSQEQKVLGTELRIFPVVLQRFGVEIGGTARERLEDEVRRIGHCMRDMFGYGGGGKGKVEDKELCKDFRVVCSEKCWMTIGVKVPVTIDRLTSPVDDLGITSEVEAEGANTGWRMDTIAKMLLLVSALERELLMLSTGSAVLEYWPLSRFWEYLAVKDLRREKKEMWHALRVGEKEKPNAKTKQRLWIQRSENVSGYSKAFEEDMPGLWTAVDEMLGRGSGVQGLRMLLQEMRTFEGRGGKMAITFEYPARNPEDELPNPSLGPSSIVFRGYHSTLDAEKLLAYIDVVTCIIDYATSQPYASLRHKVSSFRETANEIDEEPEKSFERLLNMLEAKPTTKKALITDPKNARKQKERENAELDNLDSIDVQIPPSSQIQEDLFTPLETLLRETQERETDYMSLFIQRYAEVGGFDVVSRTKLHDLLIADDLAHTSTVSTTKKDEI